MEYVVTWTREGVTHEARLPSTPEGRCGAYLALYNAMLGPDPCENGTLFTSHGHLIGWFEGNRLTIEDGNG